MQYSKTVKPLIPSGKSANTHWLTDWLNERLTLLSLGRYTVAVVALLQFSPMRQEQELFQN